MVFCPEAIKAKNSMAAAFPVGRAHCIFTRRLNAPVQASDGST